MVSKRLSYKEGEEGLGEAMIEMVRFSVSARGNAKKENEKLKKRIEKLEKQVK